MHDGRSDGVTRAVEGLEHDHAVGIGDVAVTQNAQAGDGKGDDERIVGKETNDRLGKDDEKDADDAEKEHVVKAGAPHGSFRALRLLGAQVLANKGSGRVAQAPTRHQDEDEYANGDRIAGERCRAEDADDADEADPTGVRDGKLQDAGQRDAQEAEQDAEVDMKLAAENADALRAAEETVELIEHADAAAGEGRESRAGHPKFWERTPAKDEARVENEIDDVGYPEQTHGDGSVTRAAEDGVVEKEEHDGGATAEGDAGVGGADGNDLPGSTHQAKQVRGVEQTRNADKGGNRDSYNHGLDPGNGCADGILFTDAASDHGRGGKAQAEADGHDEAEERFGEADGGDGVRAQTAYPENVDDGEEGFPHHLENHENGKQENGAIEIASGKVLVRVTKGV